MAAIRALNKPVYQDRLQTHAVRAKQQIDKMTVQKIKDRKNALRKSVMPVDMKKLETSHFRNV